MAIEKVVDLGPLTAYDFAVEGGYEGTEEEFEEGLAASADYAENAAASATSAAGSATSATGSARDSEAWAVGQRGGVDVESDDETYENNAKYYAEQAGGSAASAAGSATSAASSAESVATSAAQITKNADDITDLKSAVNKSGMQLLPVQENRTFTLNDVTFTMTNGVCHAQGTASNTAFIRLYYVDRYHFPDGIIPGATYHVSYETTNIKLRLDFTFYSGGDQLGSVVYFVEDGDITIPATAEGMMIRLSVAKNMTVNADASNIGIYSSLNNVELTNKVNGLLALTKLKFTFPTTANGYINNSGSLVYNESFVTTGYIKAERKIALSGHIVGVSSNLYQINAYDINQAYLGGILAGQATFDDMQIFDLPVGTKYIRITKSINSTRSFDVYYANDIDYSSDANYVYSSNIFNVEKSIKGYYVNYNSGALVSSANYNASDKIRIMPGTEYYISNFEQMAFYDENEIYIGGIYYNNGIIKNGDLPLSDDWITATGYNQPMTFVAQSNFAFVQTSITNGRLPFYTIKVNSADAGDYVEHYRTIPDLAISGSHIIDSIDADKVLADVVTKPMTIKLIGDSITAGFKGTGYNATSTGGGVQIDGDVYTNVAGHCWANSLKSYWEEKFHTCTVKNYGWTGLNSATMLQEWPYLVDDDDDVLICTIGTNDRAARSNLDQFIYNLEVIVFRALYAGKKIILMANIPASLANEMSGDKNFHMEDVEHAVRYVSNKRRVPFINLFELFTNYCKERGIDMDTLLADGLHPNDAGYDVMFYLITNALGISPKMTGATW